MPGSDGESQHPTWLSGGQLRSIRANTGVRIFSRLLRDWRRSVSIAHDGVIDTRRVYQRVRSALTTTDYNNQ